MTRIVRSMRGGQRPIKRLDLRDLREVLKDSRVWAAVGVVVRPDDKPDPAPHWDLVDGPDGDTPADISVEVLIQPGNVEVTARLGGFAGTAGVMQVPAVGDEVLVMFPDGQMDWMPVVVARLASGAVPSPTGQGPSDVNVVIMGAKVQIHDGAGGADRIPTMADLEAQRDWVEAQFSATAGHTHAVAGATTTTIVTVAAPAATPPSPEAPPTPTGTTVLEAK